MVGGDLRDQVASFALADSIPTPNMSRFLFTVWPFTGHIHPNLPIAQELQRRGHEVAFYTGSKARPLVERAGFQFFPLHHVDEAHVEFLVISSDGILSL